VNEHFEYMPPPRAFENCYCKDCKWYAPDFRAMPGPFADDFRPELIKQKIGDCKIQLDFRFAQVRCKKTHENWGCERWEAND